MGVSKVKAIALGWFGVDSVLDLAIPEIFYFKHDVGASLIIFIDNCDVDNIDKAILVLFLGNAAIKLSCRNLLTYYYIGLTVG